LYVISKLCLRYSTIVCDTQFTLILFFCLFWNNVQSKRTTRAEPEDHLSSADHSLRNIALKHNSQLAYALTFRYKFRHKFHLPHTIPLMSHVHQLSPKAGTFPQAARVQWTYCYVIQRNEGKHDNLQRTNSALSQTMYIRTIQ
jgi:hypothetical protein